jgi:hypothetical protein
MKRISKWQLIGICLSVLWAVSSIYFVYGDFSERATSFSNFQFNTCENLEGLKNQNNTTNECNSEKIEGYELFMQGVWSNAFTVALLPLPLFWLYGFIGLIVFRCYSIGSKEVINIPKLTISKKIFAYFCYVFVGFNLFVVVLVAMNVYRDTKVPVTLGYNKSITAVDNYVSAVGTWTSNNWNEKNYIIFPQQTSKIVCERLKKQCIESRAIISHTGSTASLMADFIEYDLESWTKDTIVYSNTNICYKEIFTIDLNAKTINGVEKFLDNGRKGYCKKPKDNYKEVVYRFEDGYTVYEKLKKEANPWLLKVIYSIFGN